MKCRRCQEEFDELHLNRISNISRHLYCVDCLAWMKAMMIEIIEYAKEIR